MDFAFKGPDSICYADSTMPPTGYSVNSTCTGTDGKEYVVFNQWCSGCGRAGLGNNICRSPQPKAAVAAKVATAPKAAAAPKVAAAPKPQVGILLSKPSSSLSITWWTDGIFTINNY
jgi:hypothetical protein